MITYEELLDAFWRHIDPTDPDGQFIDRGAQYRSAIFYHTIEQKNIAENSKKELGKSGRFEKPIATENVKEREDRSFFQVRTELRSRHADSHLGHLFTDGPPPTGLRYCINSAVLRFIPEESLEEEGYGEYSKLFATE